MKFKRMTERLYHSDDYSIFIEKTAEGWEVQEHGVPKNRFRTLNDAKAWTRRWIAGETIAPGWTNRVA